MSNYTRLNPDVERVVVNKASNITRGELILTRVGKVVHVAGHFYNNTGIAGDAPIYETIPSRLRPQYGYGIPCMLTTTEGNMSGYYVTLAASGTVSQGLSSLTRSGHIAGEYLLT